MIDRRDWAAFEVLLSSMGRSRHVVMNAWEAAQPQRTPEFDREIEMRVRRILEYREWQLQRLRRFHDETGGRLQMISRWKAYARAVAGRRQPRAALFSDIR